MGWDYTDFSDFYDCHGTGSTGLIGELANNFVAQGTPGSVTGKFDTARGPCAGNFGAGGAKGFSRSAVGSGVWDTRVSSGFTKCTLIGWFYLDSNTGDQEFASQARAAAASNTKQWMLRSVWQGAGDTASDDIATLFIWDHVANVFQLGAATRVSSGPFPTGVWIMIGMAVDLDLGVARIFLGVPGEGAYFDERALGSWNAFQATALDIVMIGVGSGASTSGTLGNIDHTTWWNGRALVQSEFLDHWQDSAGLPRSLYLFEESAAESAPFREPLVVVELEQDQCRLIYGESPCAAVLGTTGVRKCYNTRSTCQDTENYDASPTVVDSDTEAKDGKPQGWDVSTAEALGVSFDVSTEETTPLGIAFKPDGTKLYMCGAASDKIHQYPLSTAWDLSTVGSVEASLDISTEDSSPQSVFFKPDGTKVYFVGATNDQVREYSLGTPWDLSTAGAVAASFSVATEETNPTGLFFKSDGTKLYIVGNASDNIRQYPLSTAWDISTAGSVEASYAISTEDPLAEGLFFKADGSKVYMVGTTADRIYQYALGTAWDISTNPGVGNFEASFAFTTEDTQPRDVYISPDGLRLYMVGTSTGEVHQYSLGAASGNHGTIDGAVHVPSHVFGFGQALSFDGVDDSVEVLDPADLYAFAGTASFTVEFIVNPTSVPKSAARVIDKEFTDGSGDQGWRIYLRQSDSFLVFERILNGAADTVAASVTFGRSHLWSAVYDGTDIILYEDGVERARTTSSKSILASAEPLMIGNDAVSGTSEPFYGKIDEVRIWSTARTEAQIRERMVLPLSGQETGLEAYYPFDDDPPAIATRTLRFTKPQTSLPRSLYLVPTLVDVDTAPTRLNPGGGSRDRGVLGDRASVDVVLKDAPGSDRVVDKYRAQRISGTAQTDESGYEPLDRATYWSKWRARNLYFQNRRLRVLEGYVGQDLEDMQRREYFVDGLIGPDADGRTVVRAKDVLKLADDERAQAPPATPGELSASLTDSETTSFQATGALIADYPDEPGLVRIGDEIIEYQTRTQATADNVQFNTLSRGARGSTADAHDAEDRVQRCLEFVSEYPWKIVQTLLEDFGNVPAEFIPIADWDAEGDVWLTQFTLSAVISEPTSVSDLVGEITQQAQFFIWWDEHTQTIKLKALRAPTEDPVALDDISHLIEDASVLSEHPDQRLSQIWVFFGQKDPTEKLDSESNFGRVRIRADLEAEGSDEYGESRIKKIFSRWLETENQVSQVTKRTLDRYRNNPRTLRVRIDAKDREALRVGEVADITTRTIVDDRGVAVATRWQVIEAKEDPPGEAVTLELLEYEFTGRFAFYMESAAPTFASATEQEKKSGAWYSNDDGTMPGDGTDGYQYQ